MNKIIRDKDGIMDVTKTREAFTMVATQKDAVYQERKERIKLEMEILKEKYNRFTPVSVDMIVYGNIMTALTSAGIVEFTSEEFYKIVESTFVTTVENAPFYDEYNKYKERY